MKACASFPSLFGLPRRDRVTRMRGALFALFGLFLVGVGFVMRLRRHFGPAVPQVLWFQTRLTLSFSFRVSFADRVFLA